MASRSSSNFLDLASGDLLDVPRTPRSLPRVMTVPGIISELDDYGSNDGDSESSSVYRERKIIVANMLPLQAKKDGQSGKWCFSLDEDSILLQAKDGFSPETEVIYVGSLKVEIDASEQEEVAQKLFDNFQCVPTFLPYDLQKKFYLGFCKQQLWPLFHYMLPMCPEHGDRFDRLLWQAYVSANKIFADKVMEIINPEEDSVWVQDYHLMVLPTFLRKRYNRVKLGFFLHSPFPSSEIYRTLPVRDEILRGLLNCDLVGFHTFDYARHFLSCCSRMLGLDYESKRGHIGLDYFGRTVYIKILPVGIHMGRLESVMNLPSTSAKAREIRDQFMGKKLILGIDDMDIFKGISLKLLAVEQLLRQHPELRGKIVLVQIVNPARGSGKDVHEAQKETYLAAERINEAYGSNNYKPVILIDRPVPRFEKTAYYALAECCIVSAVRDGMNLVPYKYVVCRQGTPHMDEAMGIEVGSPRTSMLVVSEFIGCSPSLSGAIRVNPWDIDAVADALELAITMQESEKQLRHEKHYRYVSSHDVGYWSRSFMQDLERACLDHYSKRCWGIGLGLRFRVVSLSPGFRKLSIDHIVSAYKRTHRRAIFLDYDGTIISQSSIIKTPSPEVISVKKNRNLVTMGRPPCCDKEGVKKGPWTPEEDIVLVSYIQQHGPGNWRAVPTNTGLLRCSKSCRLRWTNYLRPGIKRGNFTHQEENMIIHLQALLGNRWAAIASYLPQRTDNDVKNYWNTHLKKKLRKQLQTNNSNSGGEMGRGQWEKRLQTDIRMARQALWEALTPQNSTPPNFSDSETITNPFPFHYSSKCTTSYASSTENIARLLTGWMNKNPPNNPPTCPNTSDESEAFGSFFRFESFESENSSDCDQPETKLSVLEKWLLEEGGVQGIRSDSLPENEDLIN